MRLAPASSAPVAAPARKPWLDHWLDTVRDLAELKASHPMMDAVIDEVDGRMIRVGDHWLADFASCNYLGFDLDREIIEAVPAYLDAWGTHPSWSRLLGSPVLYEQIEERLTALLGCRGLARPADDHPHPHVGDPAARRLGHDLPRRARAQDDLRRLPGRTRRAAPRSGASASRTPTTSTSCCSAERDPTRLVCMDGVNSMTGNAPDLPRVRRRRPRSTARCSTSTTRTASASSASARPSETCAVRHARQQRRPPRRRDLRQPRARRRLLEGLLVAAGLHRLPDRGQAPAEGRGAAVPLLGPVAGRLAGDRARRLRRQRDAAATRCAPSSARLTDARPRRRSTASASHTPNRSGFPIIEIPLRDHRRIDDVGRFLFDRGVYVTLAAYPLVPKDEVGFRVQLTAANTDAEVDTLIAALEELAERGELLRARACRRWSRRHDARCAPSWRRAAAWQLLLAGGALLCALYVCVPPFKGSGPVMNLLGLSPVLAILVGVRRYRPAARRSVAAASRSASRCSGSATSTRTATRASSAARCRSRRSATALYILVYPALMVGLLSLVRRRNPHGDRAGAHRRADHDARPRAALVGRADRAVPARRLDGRRSPKLVSVAYPVGDILLLAAAVRLALDGGRREPAFYLLSASIIALLVTDFVYGLVTLNGAYDDQVCLDVGWIGFYLLWGAAALHPSMRELDRAGARAARRASRRSAWRC